MIIMKFSSAENGPFPTTKLYRMTPGVVKRNINTVLGPAQIAFISEHEYINSILFNPRLIRNKVAANPGNINLNLIFFNFFIVLFSFVILSTVERSHTDQVAKVE